MTRVIFLVATLIVYWGMHARCFGAIMANHAAEIILIPFLAKLIFLTMCPFLFGYAHPTRQTSYWTLMLAVALLAAAIHAGELGQMLWLYERRLVTTSIFFSGRITHTSVFLSILFSTLGFLLGYEFRKRIPEPVPVFEFEQKK